MKRIKQWLLYAGSAILVYPILLVVLVPLTIYRETVKYLVKFISPEVYSIVGGWDAFFCYRDYCQIPCTMTTYFILSSPIDKNYVFNLFHEKVMKSPKYKKLAQYVVKKFGFFFWNKYIGFNLENHILYLHPECPDTPVNISEIRAVCQHLSKLPFPPDRSPWQLILVPNLVDPDNSSVKSCIIFRTSHSLMDGLSVSDLFLQVSEKKWILGGIKTEKDKTTENCVTQRVLKFAQLLFTGPYHAVQQVFCTDDKSGFLQNVLKNGIHPEIQMLHRFPWKMDGERLKKIRDKHQVGMSSLLVALGTEISMRRIRKTWKHLPESIILHMSFPIPGHPDTLTNHFAVVRIHMKVTKENDSVETLNIIHKHYQRAQQSSLPVTSYMVSHMLGNLPISMIPKPENFPPQTILLSNVPGPATISDIFGYEILDSSVCGTPIMNTAFGIMCLSYDGKFWIDIMGAKSVLPEDNWKLQEDIKAVVEELEGRSKVA